MDKNWIPYRQHDDHIYLGESEFVGEMPVRDDAIYRPHKVNGREWQPTDGGILILPADNPEKLRMGWVIYEEVGIVMVNDYAVARTSVDTSK